MAAGAYISRQAFTYLTRTLVEFARLRSTAPLLAPYVDDILGHVILPKTFFTAALHRQWQEDQMEVIRKNSATLTAFDEEDMYDPRDAAIFMCLEVMKVKALREKALEPFMARVLAIAQAHRAEHGAHSCCVYDAAAAAMQRAACMPVFGAAVLCMGQCIIVILKCGTHCVPS